MKTTTKLLRVGALASAMVVALFGRAQPYEVWTHAKMTENAVKMSDLPTYFPGELGIPSDYVLVAPRSLPKDLIHNDGVNDGTPNGWLQEGSVREDNLDMETADNTLSSSRCWGFRVCNHFYNPLRGAPNGGALTFLFQLGAPAPDWALEDQQDDSEQDFSFKDARQHFYLALTQPARMYRDYELAMTLRRLGQAVHLLEDMAQPQHTRNDRHADVSPTAVTGPVSHFEKWTEDHRQRKSNGRFVDYTSYPPVYPDEGHQPRVFTSGRSFWHTDGGAGMADYSNGGFVSVGTNFKGFLSATTLQRDDAFPNPDGYGVSFTTIRIQDIPGVPAGLTGDMDFIGSMVEDHYRSNRSALNPFTSTYSLFDEDLKNSGKGLQFAINRFNIEAALDFLVPRAVGYSAGLVNYFFRGKIDFA